MAYESWKKEGRVLVPCRVIGLALELLCRKEAESDPSLVKWKDCAVVQFWLTQKLLANGSWSPPGTRKVPVLLAHQRLTFYIWQRLYSWIAGLSLVVSNAIVPKSHAEGKGHHDLVLKHGSPNGPWYCSGIISTELKISSIGPRGRGFERVWTDNKEACVGSMASVLRAKNARYAAALLVVVGVCDDEKMMAQAPPLFVKAQLLALGADNTPQWGKVLLDRGTVPVERIQPPPKRQRKGASWDEVRAYLNGKAETFDNVQYVRLLDMFRAISEQKATSNPGQKMATYCQAKHLGFKEGQDYIRKRFPAGSRGSEPYWLTWAAAERVFAYEVLR